MFNIVDVRLDIENIPKEYKLSEDMLSHHLENLKSRKAASEWVPIKRSDAEKAVMAIKQDVQIINERLDKLGIAPEIVQAASNILWDFGMGNQVDISRMVALAESATPNVLREVTAIYAQRLFAADLRTCIHAWQLRNALQEEIGNKN